MRPLFAFLLLASCTDTDTDTDTDTGPEVELFGVSQEGAALRVELYTTEPAAALVLLPGDVELDVITDTDGHWSALVPLADPCTTLGTEVEVAVLVGRDEVVTTLQLDGLVVDGSRVIPAGPVPVAVCTTDRTAVKVEVPYLAAFRLTSSEPLYLTNGVTAFGVSLPGTTDVELAAGRYDVEVDTAPWVLVVEVAL